MKQERREKDKRKTERRERDDKKTREMEKIYNEQTYLIRCNKCIAANNVECVTQRKSTKRNYVKEIER